MPSNSLPVLRLAQPPLRRFLPALGLGLLSALCSVALLATSAWLITRAAEHPPILFLSAAIVGVRAFALGRAGFHYAERLTSHSAAFRQLGALRVGIYRRLEPLAPDNVTTTSRGDLMTRLVADVDRLPDLPLRVVQPLVVAAVTSLLAVVGVSILLPAAGLALAIALVLGFAAATAAHSAIAARAERAIAPLRATLADQVLETVSELDVLIAFDAIDERVRAIDSSNRMLTAATLRRALGAGATSALLAALAGLATVVSLAIAIPAMTSGSITAPTLAVIALVPIAVFDVMGGAPLAVSAWRQVKVSAARVAAVTAVELPASSSTAVLREGSASVSLRGLSVRWPGARSDALHDFDLEIGPGDRVHIAGPTGAGKTTLAHALVGFLPYAGSYRIDGVEARRAPAAELHRIVGLCEQQPYLFDSDLRQNLLFARDTATDDELLDMLERVGLRGWAENREGLETRLGDGGSLVSGGQAQRIALARALLADFPVVVFDEPTANVEESLAAELMADILVTAGDENRAVIVISHTAIDPALITRTVNLDPPRERLDSDDSDRHHLVG